MPEDLGIPLTAAHAEAQAKAHEDSGGGDDGDSKRAPADLGARPAGKADPPSDDGDREPSRHGKPEDKGDDDDEEEGEDKPKPKGRKRKVKRGKEDLEVDLDDEDGLLALISDPAKYRVKVDKEEREVTLEDLTRDYELRSASQKRLNEASELQNRLNAWPQMLKQDRGKLKEFLMDVVGLEDPFEPLYEEFLADQEMRKLLETNPEEYARQKAEQEVLKERARVKREQERQAEAERQRQINEGKAKFQKALPDALKAHGLELDDVTWPILQRVGPQMSRAGMDVTPESVAYEAARIVQDFVASRIPADPAALVELLGPDKLKTLYKHAADEEKARQRKVARGENRSDSGDGSSSRGREKPKEIKSVSEIMRLR